MFKVAKNEFTVVLTDTPFTSVYNKAFSQGKTILRKITSKPTNNKLRAKKFTLQLNFLSWTHLRVRESRGYSCLGLVCNIHSFAIHSCPEPAALMYSHVSCNRWLFIIADHVDIPLRDNYCSNPLDNSLPFVIVSHLCTKQTLKTYLFAGVKFLDKHICQH